MVYTCFEISEDNYEKILELKKKINVSSVQDVLNYGLSLVDWIVKCQEKGLIVGSIDKKNKKVKEYTFEK